MAFATPRLDVLTRGQPRLDAKRLLKDFARSVRPALAALGLPGELHFKQVAGDLLLTLGPHRMRVRVPAHPYWGEDGDQAPAENNIWEYGPRAAWMEEEGAPDADGLEDAILDSKGAIIIESVETGDAQQVVLLMAHLAGAAMDDAVALLAPTSGAIVPASGQVRDELRGAQTLVDVLRFFLRNELVPVAGDDPLVQIAVETDHWYVAYGLHPFGLPDVGLRFRPDPAAEGDQWQEVAAAVQSLVTYMLDRRSPLPVGDTMTLQGQSTIYRVVEGTFPPYEQGTCGSIELVPA